MVRWARDPVLWTNLLNQAIGRDNLKWRLVFGMLGEFQETGPRDIETHVLISNHEYLYIGGEEGAKMLLDDVFKSLCPIVSQFRFFNGIELAEKDRITIITDCTVLEDKNDLNDDAIFIIGLRLEK